MFVFVRAITWATLFISLVFVYVPARLLAEYGIAVPESFGIQQVVGMMIGTAGAAVTAWCVFAFATKGKGTPAPFDPPRQLVTTGPYRFVRNPMYVGAGFGMMGAALYFGSLQLLVYTAILFVIVHVLIIVYEEPILNKMFGEAYTAYCKRVSRWMPSI